MNQHSSTESSVSSSNGSSAEAISRRAYEIWEREGRPEGCDLRHWLQAEQELGVRHADNRDEATSSGASRFTASNPSRTSPAQAQSSQPARAANKPDSKRASNPPFGSERSSSGASQSAAKKKPSSAPMM